MMRPPGLRPGRRREDHHAAEDRDPSVRLLIQHATHFPRALALCADSDLFCRRAEFEARRVHDDRFFNQPYFAHIELPR